MNERLHQAGRRRVSRDVAAWRRSLLLRAGFGLVLAEDLADDGRIDLHELLGLVDRGCTPQLAARILAPL
jgi:hypothetical protein